MVENGGTHILKPVSSVPFNLYKDVPANEAVTMLLPRSCHMTTAASGLLRTQGAQFAYITKRFDRDAHGAKRHQEDFGSLAGMTAATHGKNWKYTSTYERIGHLIERYSSLPALDLEEFFNRVVSCFVCGNGDADIRNFSMIRDADGSTRLSPAYDLLCTHVHLPNESDLAMTLLESEIDGGPTTAPYTSLGYYSAVDFMHLAAAIGVPEHVARPTINGYLEGDFLDEATNLVSRSFLSDEAQSASVGILNERIEKLISQGSF